MRRSAEEIGSRAATGPPEGVPEGLPPPIDPDGGRVAAVSLFETEEDLRKGHEALNAMNPTIADVGKRTSVETYEVAVDVRA